MLLPRRHFVGRLRKKTLHEKGRMECAAGCRRQFSPAVSGNATFTEDAKVDLVQNNNSKALRNPHWVKYESAKFLQGKNPHHFLIFLQPFMSFLLSLEAFFAPLSSLLSQKIEFVVGRPLYSRKMRQWRSGLSLPLFVTALKHAAAAL